MGAAANWKKAQSIRRIAAPPPAALHRSGKWQGYFVHPWWPRQCFAAQSAVSDGSIASASEICKSVYSPQGNFHENRTAR
jgi:hypothetical protein